jgi:UDPglucose 6-dehydrogenase
MENAKDLIPGMAFAGGPYEVADGAEAVVIVTEWNAFRALDLGRMKRMMAGDLLVDLRNIYRSDEVVRHGLRYVSIGRPAAAR